MAPRLILPKAKEVVTFEVKINNKTLYKRILETDKIDIYEFLYKSNIDIQRLLDKGMYEDSTLIEAINNNKFNGWI